MRCRQVHDPDQPKVLTPAGHLCRDTYPDKLLALTHTNLSLNQSSTWTQNMLPFSCPEFKLVLSNRPNSKWALLRRSLRSRFLTVVTSDPITIIEDWPTQRNVQHGGVPFIYIECPMTGSSIFYALQRNKSARMTPLGYTKAISWQIHLLASNRTLAYLFQAITASFRQGL